MEKKILPHHLKAFAEGRAVLSNGQHCLNVKQLKQAMSGGKIVEIANPTPVGDGTQIVQTTNFSKPETAAALIEKIGQANTTETVQGILSAEEVGENRKTVVKAAETKLEELGKANSPERVLATIESEEDEEVIGKILEAEKAGENRADIVDAAEAKLEELTKPE